MFVFFKHSFLALLLLFMANSSVAALVIQSRIDNGAWKKTTAIYPLKGQKITLKVAKMSGATIRWYQILPDLSEMYKNANHPWEKNPYQWAGFGKIDYERKKLTQFRGQWEIQPFEYQRNAISPRFYQEDVGSFWFQVEIEKRGKVKSKNRRVLRIQMREGCLQKFFEFQSETVRAILVI